MSLIGVVVAASVAVACQPETETEQQPSAALPAAAERPRSAMPAAATSGPLRDVEEQWGVRIDSVRRSAAGYALDFRYWVTDREKATPILQRKLSPNPHLVVQKSGAVLQVPRSKKVGAMRQSVRVAEQIKNGTRYFVLFANPGRHVDVGDRVTIVIGDFRVEDVPVL